MEFFKNNDSVSVKLGELSHGPSNSRQKPEPNNLRRKQSKLNRHKHNYSSIAQSSAPSPMAEEKRAWNEEESKQDSIFQSFQKVRIRKGPRQYQSIDVGEQRRSKTKLMQREGKIKKDRDIIIKRIMDYKSAKIQQEATRMIEQQQLFEKEKNKYINDVNKRIKRNEKLKNQLEKWEKDKEEKQMKILEQLQKHQENQKVIEEQIRQHRLNKKLKIEQFKAQRDAEQKKQEDLKREQKRKFFEDISYKKAIIKKEFNTLKGQSNEAIPRYDLRTNEIIRKSPKNTIIEEKSCKEEDDVTSSTPKLITNIRSMGSKHVLDTLVNTTISALAIYKNHLPSPRRSYPLSLLKRD